MTSARLRGWGKLGAALAVVALTGCGSGTEPTPAVPSILGEYTGTWTQTLLVDGQPTFQGQPIPPITCPCTLSIPSQTGNTFFGRSVLSAPCDQGLFFVARGAGGVLSISSASIEASGAVSFRFGDDPPLGVSVAGGCGVTRMDAFTGTFSNGSITASRNEGYDCTPADGHRYSLAIQLAATRR